MRMRTLCRGRPRPAAAAMAAAAMAAAALSLSLAAQTDLYAVLLQQPGQQPASDRLSVGLIRGTLRVFALGMGGMAAFMAWRVYVRRGRARRSHAG